MGSVSEYIIAIFELAEAEGRTLKQEIIKLLISFVLLIIFAFFVLGAYVLFIYGLYAYLTCFMSTYVASFILAGVSLLIAVMLLGLIKWKL